MTVRCSLRWIRWIPSCRFSRRSRAAISEPWTRSVSIPTRCSGCSAWAAEELAHRERRCYWHDGAYRQPARPLSGARNRRTGRMDALVERLSRKVAQRTSRRGFLGYLGKALVGGMMIPLLPINRVVEQTAHAAEGEAEGGDLTSCDYWRYCGFDGYLCSCCGGSLTSCPPGTAASPTSWVGTCQHPTDGKEYIIAYRDCCGKDVCNRCFCDNNKGQVPIYRPQLDNDIIWCFGA